MNFTHDEFKEFFRLVTMSGSQYQMDRINSRLEMPGFIRRVGRDLCDEMFALINEGYTPATVFSKGMKK